VTEKSITIFIEDERFAFGAFRDAFKGRSEGGIKWVIKKYNAKARNTIVVTLESTTEAHARKQVQMHTVARHLGRKFATQTPESFGKSFSYNTAYYAVCDGTPVTVEEFVPGEFTKYINNDGLCTRPSGISERVEEVFQKAECFAHHTYVTSNQKFMILDIQGSEYSLYDPEIATEEHCDEDEYYFCCGNLSSLGINNFLNQHKCNKFCNMMINSKYLVK
jgi:hypothetical protein